MSTFLLRKKHKKLPEVNFRLTRSTKNYRLDRPLVTRLFMYGQQKVLDRVYNKRSLLEIWRVDLLKQKSMRVEIMFDK